MKAKISINSLIFFLPVIVAVSCSETGKKTEATKSDSTVETRKTAPERVQSVAQLSSVKIGSQTWTNRNFTGTTYRNGDPIPECKTAQEWQQHHVQGMGCWCWQENNPEMDEYYGKIYNFYSMTDARLLAPYGWHMPTKQEWEQMYMELGGIYDSQPKLKSINGWFRDTNGNDQSGFFGTAGGYRTDEGDFKELTKFGMWWSALDDEGQTWIQNLSYNDGDPSRRYGTRGGGFSVRLVKD